VFGEFEYVPLLVGDCSPEAIAELLTDLAIGTTGTLVVVSSDLSHYLSHSAALQTDMATLTAIEAFHSSLDVSHACGAMALNGLSVLAKQQNWKAMALDRRDSTTLPGTTYDSVVGYGAIAYYSD